jgi:hypothetical protein
MSCLLFFLRPDVLSSVQKYICFSTLSQCIDQHVSCHQYPITCLILGIGVPQFLKHRLCLFSVLPISKYLSSISTTCFLRTPLTINHEAPTRGHGHADTHKVTQDATLFKREAILCDCTVVAVHSLVAVHAVVAVGFHPVDGYDVKSEIRFHVREAWIVRRSM